jgi:hypothetical protein
MQPYLPQNDPNPALRKQTLEDCRREYFFNYNYILGYPFLDHVPKRATPLGWCHSPFSSRRSASTASTRNFNSTPVYSEFGQS